MRSARRSRTMRLALAETDRIRFYFWLGSTSAMKAQPMTESNTQDLPSVLSEAFSLLAGSDP